MPRREWCPRDGNKSGFLGTDERSPAFTPADPGPNVQQTRHGGVQTSQWPVASSLPCPSMKACGRVADHDAGPCRSLLRGRRRHSMTTVFPMTTCLLTVSGSHAPIWPRSKPQTQAPAVRCHPGLHKRLTRLVPQASHPIRQDRQHSTWASETGGRRRISAAWRPLSIPSCDTEGGDSAFPGH